MPRLGTLTLPGRSGGQYKFNAYALGTAFKEGLSAVYVLTRRTHRDSVGRFRHKPLLIGQTANLRQPLELDARTMAASGANCICVHREQNETARAAIRQDLLPAAVA
jgi:hypothetical protein